jgi:hypothetical protein
VKRAQVRNISGLKFLLQNEVCRNHAGMRNCERQKSVPILRAVC